MALNINRGSMSTQTWDSTQKVRQMDPAMYQRMANDKKAALVCLLRLIGMKRSNGNAKGFAIGQKAVNCKSYKYEWEDFYAGDPLSAIAVAPTTAATDTDIYIPKDDVGMFQPQDTILDRNTKELMLVKAVTTETVSTVEYGKLTVERAWGQTAATTIAKDDVLVLIANAFSEGTNSPLARSYNPTQEFNYTQIFKRAVENTGTNEVTQHYGNVNKLSFQREEEWHQFLIERSRAFYKGTRKEWQDADGKMKRTTGGLDYFIKSNIFRKTSFTYNNFVDFCEMAYGYGGSEKLLVVNPALFSLINKYVFGDSHSVINLTTDTKKYGINLKRLVTPFGDMDMLVDLTMKDLYDEPTGFALELGLIEEMILRPDVWKENVQANDWDGRKDMVIGECGLKVISEQRHAKITIGS